MVDARGGPWNDARIRAVAFIALLLGLTVPVAQLRASTVVRAPCCCPDPAQCHCPDHTPNPTPTVAPCGKNARVSVAPALGGFVVPEAVAAAVTVPGPAPILPRPAPHAPPDPERPSGPS